MNHVHWRRRFWLRLAGAVLVICGVTAPLAFASAGPSRQVKDTPGESAQWVAAWGASPQDLGDHNFTGTIRNVVFAAVGGDSVRVRLTNTFGNGALPIGDAYIGVSDADGTISGAEAPLTFAGSRTITIPQGAEALSDPVSLTVPAPTHLAVSVYVPQATELTGHALAQATTYVAVGADHAADTTTAAYVPNGSASHCPGDQVGCVNSAWYLVDSVDVLAPRPVKGTVVALGDSITDGAYSTVNGDRRWPNDLARRLVARAGVTMSVVDEGIAGNQVLRDTSANGVGALNRFDRDVVDRAGVRDVVLLEGVNDIAGGVSASQLIAGYQQLIAQAHAAGLKIFGATLTPLDPSGWSAGKEQVREAVNNWIVTSGAFDGVVDFASALADPGNPRLLNPAYDSGDHEHPNDAGYQAMADAIDLSMFLRR